jgi:Cd2+/Zn2+-exporting ATPase
VSSPASAGVAAPGQRTLRVDLPIVLPGVDHAGDACIQRVMDRLAGQRGILDAHVVGGDEDRDPALPAAGVEAELCLHYDPDDIDLETVERLVEDAGAAVEDRFGHERLRVGAMDCADCVTSIEHVVARHPGVLDVSVNYAAERMHVEWDSNETDLAAIVDRVEAMGYPISTGDEHHDPGNRRLMATIAAAGLLAVGFALETLVGVPEPVAVAFYAAAYVGAGWDATRHAVGALRAGSLDIDVLMVAAALGAASLGLWAEGALLLVLFSLGHALEHRALDRARSAIAELGRLTPETARRVSDEGTEEIAIETVQVGDRVLVRPGDRIPVDGTIVEGTSAVDEATLTGEHQPARKTPGEAVYAGTVNGDERLIVEATSAGEDTTLAHVADLVERAQRRKAGLQRVSERVERWLTPTVLVLVALLALVPPLTALAWPGAPSWLALPWRTAITRSIAVLVASAPCALAISTPAAVFSALAGSAHEGILVKGGDHLETLGHLEAVAFDKTGTLTAGRFTLTDIHARTSEDELLRTAASLEHDIAHPIAKAIVAAAQERQLSLAPVDELASDPGRGVAGTLEGAAVRVGNREHVGSIPDEVAERARELEAAGRSLVFVETDGEIDGVLGLADRARPEAPDVLARIREAGVEHTAMLTGDNETAAQAVAQATGIDEVHAELSPEDKIDRVRAMAGEHEHVAFVGDGVNDAPAMAQAHLAVAMGARGSDVALETADVALLGDSLEPLPGALGLGKRTRSIIHQNLAISLGVIALLVPLAALGLAGIAPAIVVHEGSTLLVVANGLRLL